MDLTLRERQLIEQSFALLEQADDSFVAHFYDCLFMMAPLIKPMFSSDRKLLEKHFESLLSAAVGKINQFHKLHQTLFDLGRKHRQYKVEKMQFGIVKSAFLLTIEYQLKTSSSKEIIQAWGKYFDQIAEVMIRGLEADAIESALALEYD